MSELQTTWSWLPALYLFLGGLSAGSYITVSVLHLVRPWQYKKIVAAGVWVSVLALAIGLFALVAEVQKPFQAMLMFKSFVNGSSWMAIGAWMLLLTFIIFLINALFITYKSAKWLGSLFKPLKNGRNAITKALAIIGIFCSLGVAVYTGILLSAAPGIPLWDSWLIPVLFTISALDTGVSSVVIITLFSEKDVQALVIRAILEKVMIVLVLLESIALAVFLVAMQNGGRATMQASGLLVNGSLSIQFWLLVVSVGLAAPLALALSQVIMAKIRHEGELPASFAMGGAACALVGGFTLRFLVLTAGLHAALVSPAVLQAAQGIFMSIP